MMNAQFLANARQFQRAVARKRGGKPAATTTIRPQTFCPAANPETLSETFAAQQRWVVRSHGRDVIL